MKTKTHRIAALALLLAAPCFAVPDMTLYEDGELIWQISGDAICNSAGETVSEIRGGNLYDAQDGGQEGTISETGDRLVLTFHRSMKQYEFSRTTGFLLLKFGWWWHANEEHVYEYDEETGRLRRLSWYLDAPPLTPRLDRSQVFEYENGRRARILTYGADGSLIAAEVYEYEGDRRTKKYEYKGGRLESCHVFEYEADRMKRHLTYDADGRLLETEEYAD